MLPISPAAHIKTETSERVRATLQWLPSTVEDLVQTTGMRSGEVIKILGEIGRKREVMSMWGTRRVFYVICCKPDGMEEK